MSALALRLALAGIRRRPGSAALVAGVLAGAAAVLTLALAVARVSDAPWLRTFEATDGSHVEASRIDPRGRPARAAAMPGVVAVAGPWEEALTSLSFKGRRLGAHLVAGQEPRSAVAHPIVTSGRWLRPGEAVLERSFAESIGARAGDRLRIGGRTVRVSGVAVSTSREPYPQAQPGTVHVARRDLHRLVPDARDRGETWALRLAHPGEVASFVERARAALPGVHLRDWTRTRAAAASVDEPRRIALFSFALFLMLAAVGIVGVTVGARVIERERDLGVMRAIGATPRLVMLLLFAEYALLGLAGAAAGLAAGQLLAPAFTARSAALLSTTDTAGLRVPDALLVVACVFAVTALAVLLPAWRAARRPVAQAVALRTRPARLGPALGRLGLPLPVALGASQATARRGRAVLTVLALSVTVVTAVAALSMEATFDNQVREAVEAPEPPPLRSDARLAPPVVDTTAAEVTDTQRRLRPIVYGLGGVLLAVSLLTLLATTQLGARERAREHAVSRAVGLTPRQVLASVAASGALLGALAAIAGIPIGAGYFLLATDMAGGAEDAALPSAVWLILLLPASVLLTAAAAVPAARVAAHARPADLLRDQ